MLHYLKVFDMLENDRTYVNQNPKCEPQLGKRGLYDAIGGMQDARTVQLAMLWVLNLSDGGYSLLDICERSGLRFDLIREAAEVLKKSGLLTQLD